MTAANEMVNLGLKDLGYEYVNSKIYPWEHSIVMNSDQSETLPSRRLLVHQGREKQYDGPLDVQLYHLPRRYLRCRGPDTRSWLEDRYLQQLVNFAYFRV